MTAPATENFDCIRFVREARARIHEETKHMSAEEFVQWLRARRPTHPELAAMKDRSIEPLEAARRAAAARAAERQGD